MIVLFTDFGTGDPYVGQMHAAVREQVEAPVVDLLHHAPNYDMRAGAYLLDALQRPFRPGAIFVGVVDPGVGGQRAPVMIRADGKWYVGPDNGLFGMVCRRARTVESYRIDWRPETLSTSFHGRDLFAPVAAQLFTGTVPESRPWWPVDTGAWPDELTEVIYIDHYGNAMTGVRAESLSKHTIVRVGDRRLDTATTFSAARDGEPFWYRNSVGLVEIAVKRGSAAALLGLKVGDEVTTTDYQSLLDGET